MRNFAVALAVLCLLGLEQSAEADELDRIAAAVAAIEDQSANFTQTFRTHGSDHAITETGVVTFGTLPRMRWSYRTPEEKVFVFDGTTSWLYIPADEQVSVHRLTEGEREQLPFLLLKDAERTRSSFQISGSLVSGSHRISLDPKGSSSIRSLVISIDSKTSRIQTLEYQDVEGNATRFEFSNYRQASTGPATFRFEAPEGVDVVQY